MLKYYPHSRLYQRSLITYAGALKTVDVATTKDLVAQAKEICVGHELTSQERNAYHLS